MSAEGPDNVLQMQEDIRSNFSTIKLSNSEIGTCKKVYHLPENVALAVTHGNSGSEKELIHNEHIYLRFLQEQGYPVVKCHGQVFAVEENGGRSRYGYLMDYISSAVFVEAKTPILLKTQIFAALLQIPTLAREAWWAMNSKKLEDTIRTQLEDPEKRARLQANAAVLESNFMRLMAKLEQDKLAIADLQIMLSPDGQLTIIDPLDVVKIDPELNLVTSVFHPDRKPASGFIPFLIQTNDWLTRAVKICHDINNAPTARALQGYVSDEHASVSARRSYVMSQTPREAIRGLREKADEREILSPQSTTPKKPGAFK